MKNIKTINIIILVITCTLILFACSTDNPVQQTTKSKSELIIGTWLLDSSLAPGQPNYPGSKNNLRLTLSQDNKFQIVDSTKEIVNRGTWELKNLNENDLTKSDSLFIVLRIPGINYNQQIIILTETKLQLKYIGVFGYLVNDYYTKQK